MQFKSQTLSEWMKDFFKFERKNLPPQEVIISRNAYDDIMDQCKDFDDALQRCRNLLKSERELTQRLRQENNERIDSTHITNRLLTDEEIEEFMYGKKEVRSELTRKDELIVCMVIFISILVCIIVF